MASLSGPGGAHLRTFDSSTGHLLLEKRLHDPAAGRLQEPGDLGTAIAFGPDGEDIYILTNGYIVRRADRKTGEVKWGWTAPDQTYVSYTLVYAVT